MTTKQDIKAEELNADYIEEKAQAIIKEMKKPSFHFGYIFEKCEQIKSFIELMEKHEDDNAWARIEKENERAENAMHNI